MRHDSEASRLVSSAERCIIDNRNYEAANALARLAEIHVQLHSMRTSID